MAEEKRREKLMRRKGMRDGGDDEKTGVGFTYREERVRVLGVLKIL